jgi:hypothetical protein
MRLPAREQRALEVMEEVLEASEPGMTARFAMFASLSGSGEPVSAECLSRRQSWCQPGTFYILFPVLASIVLAVAMAAGLAMSASSVCGKAAAARATLRPVATCVTHAHP